MVAVGIARGPGMVHAQVVTELVGVDDRLIGHGDPAPWPAEVGDAGPGATQLGVMGKDVDPVLIQREVDPRRLRGGVGREGPSVIVTVVAVIVDGEGAEDVRLPVAVGVSGKRKLAERGFPVEPVDRLRPGEHDRGDLVEGVGAGRLGVQEVDHQDHGAALVRGNDARIARRRAVERPVLDQRGVHLGDRDPAPERVSSDGHPVAGLPVPGGRPIETQLEGRVAGRIEKVEAQLRAAAREILDDDEFQGTGHLDRRPRLPALGLGPGR